MKFSAGIAAALVGCASAAKTASQAYVFPRPDSSSPEAMTRSLARLVFLQRLAAPGEGPSSSEIPDDVSVEAAVSTLNRFGEPPAKLFSYAAPEDVPNRLLVMLEGMTQQQLSDANKALGSDAAFTISDSPSTNANEKFFDVDVHNVGAKSDHGCSLSKIMELNDDDCWSDKATAVKYNLDHNSDSFDKILKELKTLPSLGDIGRVVSTIVLVPQDAAHSKLHHWSDKPQELRRRQAEQVISVPEKAVETESTTSGAPTSTSAPRPTGPVPTCFSSEKSCMEGTGNCSEHGHCINKYGKAPETPKEGDVCYVCSCQGTKSGNSSVTHWGGATCAKQDVSVPFWLFVTTGVFLVGIVYFSIGLLYGIGEEKLPGVIGAGVSRSK